MPVSREAEATNNKPITGIGIRHTHCYQQRRNLGKQQHQYVIVGVTLHKTAVLTAKTPTATVTRLLAELNPTS